MKWLLASLLLAAPAQAEEVWAGIYTCAQGPTEVTLTVEAGADGTASALFHFYGTTATNPAVPEGCFAMAGRVDPATGHVDLRAGRWLLRPDGYVTVDLHGSLEAGGVAGRTDGKNVMAGTVSGPGCSDFMLARSGTLPSDPSHSPAPCYAAPVS